MPSFSVEVPGEAAPLHEQILVNTLHSAASSHPQQIQSGTKQLQEWEKTPGFYKHLQSACLDQRLPTELRYLAVIQLKNGIDKYWRKTAQNAVPKDDKAVIRSRLLSSLFNEPDHRLALQNALVIAKIARYEFPTEWPDAISGFLDCIQESSPSAVRRGRSLLALLHIVKELSTSRLLQSRKHLVTVTPQVVTVVGAAYENFFDGWLASSSGDGEYSLLALRLLRRLIITSYDHPGPNHHSEAVSFWELSIQHLRRLLLLADNDFALVGKHIIQLAKFHHAMIKDRPAAFALLPNSVELAKSYWSLVEAFGSSYGSRDKIGAAAACGTIGSDGDVRDEKPFIEKVALRGLLIVRACVKMVHNPTKTFRYRTSEDKEETNRATQHIRETLLSEHFVHNAMEFLVSRFFVFTASDLKDWVEEPEEWEKREEGDSEDWEFSIRSCAEKLFLDLAINYKQVIVQPLLTVFYSVANLQNEDILLKDSVYTAVGLAAPAMYENLDFDAFIRDVLILEVQKKNAGLNILRRRIAILLGQWISVKVASETRPLVFQIFQHLLNAEDPLNDQVVRVTAGRRLLDVVND